MTGVRAILTGLMIWGLATQPAAARSAQTDLEYSVKANYLIRFAAFVEWSPRAFTTPRAPLVICVVGRDPFGSGLDQAARGQTAFGHPLAIRRPVAREELAGCHIAYVGQGGDSFMEGLNSRQNLLEVTDSTVSTRRGMIHFAISNGRVRFHVDLGATTRARLAMSSRLLNLALSVEGG